MGYDVTFTLVIHNARWRCELSLLGFSTRRGGLPEP